MPSRAMPELPDGLPQFQLRLPCLPREGNLDMTGCTRAQTQHKTIKVYLVVQAMGIVRAVCSYCGDTGCGVWLA